MDLRVRRKRCSVAIFWWKHDTALNRNGATFAPKSYVPDRVSEDAERNPDPWNCDSVELRLYRDVQPLHWRWALFDHQGVLQGVEPCLLLLGSG